MGQELNKPILDKKPKDGKATFFRYGMNEIKGWKKRMEVFLKYTLPTKGNIAKSLLQRA